MHKKECEKKYQIKLISSNNNGLFATKTIYRAEKIISEKSILTGQSEADILSKYMKLNQQNKTIFDNLHNQFPEINRIHGIFKTHAIPLGENSNIGGIFPIISRCNHSCKANAISLWDNIDKVEKLFAIKKINPNEEIRVNYNKDYLNNTQQRIAQLQQQFNFICNCECCTQNDEQSNKNLDYMQSIHSGIVTGMPNKPEQTLLQIYDLLKLIKFEFPNNDHIYYVSCYDLFQNYIYLQDKKNAHKWLYNAYICSKIYLGENDDFVKKNTKYLSIERIHTHPTYRFTQYSQGYKG